MEVLNMVDADISKRIQEMKKSIDNAKAEIAKAKAAGVDVSVMEAGLKELIASLEKIEAAYK